MSPDSPTIHAHHTVWYKMYIGRWLQWMERGIWFWQLQRKSGKIKKSQGLTDPVVVMVFEGLGNLMSLRDLSYKGVLCVKTEIDFRTVRWWNFTNCKSNSSNIWKFRLKSLKNWFRFIMSVQSKIVVDRELKVLGEGASADVYLITGYLDGVFQVMAMKQLRDVNW